MDFERIFGVPFFRSTSHSIMLWNSTSQNIIEPLAVKSDNLQYNMLVRWADGTNDSLTKHLTFQVFFFFHNFLQTQSTQNSLFSFLYFFGKIEKNKLEVFLQRISQDFMKKKIVLGTSDDWSTIRLFHGPTKQHFIFSIDGFVNWEKLGQKLFCLSRQKAEIFNICLMKDFVTPYKNSAHSDNFYFPQKKKSSECCLNDLKFWKVSEKYKSKRSSKFHLYILTAKKFYS